jgi:hypothetical protein
VAHLTFYFFHLARPQKSLPIPDLEGHRKSSVRIAGFLAEILTRDLPNTKGGLTTVLDARQSRRQVQLSLYFFPPEGGVGQTQAWMSALYLYDL